MTENSNGVGAGFTRGPWYLDGGFIYSERNRATKAANRASSDGNIPIAKVIRDFAGEQQANARLIAAAPDHALICWAMCVQDGRWEEWTPYDGRGEFVFAGLRYATRTDDFGCPELTPALRAALAQARGPSQ